MTILYTDSFDHYGTTNNNLLHRWDSIMDTYTKLGASTGRTGGTCLRMYDTTSPIYNASAVKYLPNGLGGVGQDALFLGASIQKVTSTFLSGTGTNWRPLMGFCNFEHVSTQSSSEAFNDSSLTAITVAIASDWSLVLRRNSTILATGSSTILADGLWHRIEMKVSNVSHDVGQVEVRIDGVADIVFTGDLLDGGPATLHSGLVRAQNCNLDDVLIWTSGGTSFNNFIGDIVIDTLRPNGVGATTQSTPLSGAAWAAVDDATLDAHTTYTAINTAGLKDTYAYSNMTVTPAVIHGVVVSTQAQSPGMTPRKLKAIARLGTTEVDGAEKTVLLNMGNGYGLSQEVYAAKPGGGAWTRADIDAAEFGWKVTQ